MRRGHRGEFEKLSKALAQAGRLSAAEETALVAADREAFSAEQYTWLQLYRACLASVESGHAIVFC